MAPDIGIAVLAGRGVEHAAIIGEEGLVVITLAADAADRLAQAWRIAVPVQRVEIDVRARRRGGRVLGGIFGRGLGFGLGGLNRCVLFRRLVVRRGTGGQARGQDK